MLIVEVTSLLPARSEDVWTRAVTKEGINDELFPIFRMTMPHGLRNKTVETVQLNVPLGRSWILLGGILPVDYDDLLIKELENGRRFLERSKTLAFEPWQHERIIEPAPNEQTRVTDRLSFDLKRSLPGAASTATAIVRALFNHRHARLAKYWRR